MGLTTGFARSSGGSKPGRLRGGNFRRAWARTVTFTRIAQPTAATGAIVCACIGITERQPPTIGIPALVAIAAALIWQGRPLEDLWRRAWHHLRWFSDARAAGLCLLAEVDVDQDHDPDDETIEVAPPLRRLTARRHLRVYDVRPLPGQTLKTYQDACDALKVRWRAHSVTAEQLTGRRLNRGRIRLTVVPADQLAKPINSRPPRGPQPNPRRPDPAPTLRIGGRTQTGRRLELSMAHHALVVGSTSGGKSGFLRQLVAAAARRVDVQLVLIDPKYVEFGRWKQRPTILAREPDEIAAATRWLVDLMDARYQLMSTHDLDTWDPTLGPWVLVVGDEIADVFEWRNHTADEHLIVLSRKARAAGICLVLATQRASADVVPSQLRGNLAQRIVFRTDNHDATEFGLPGQSKEYRAHDIAVDQPGVCFWRGVTGAIELSRVAWLEPDHVPTIDAQTAHYRLEPIDLSSAPPTTSPPQPEPDDLDHWDGLTLAELDELDAQHSTPDLDAMFATTSPLLDVLSTAGHTARQLAASTGIPEPDVRQALAELAARGYVVRGGDNRWRIGPQSTAA